MAYLAIEVQDQLLEIPERKQVVSSGTVYLDARPRSGGTDRSSLATRWEACSSIPCFCPCYLWYAAQPRKTRLVAEMTDLAGCSSWLVTEIDEKTADEGLKWFSLI